MKNILWVLALLTMLVAGTAYAAPCLNINEATPKQMQRALKGAGTKTSKAIVNHRRKMRTAALKASKKPWNFGNWNQLMKVRGVGPKFCADNLDKVCFGHKKNPSKSCPKGPRAGNKSKTKGQGKRSTNN